MSKAYADLAELPVLLLSGYNSWILLSLHDGAVHLDLMTQSKTKIFSWTSEQNGFYLWKDASYMFTTCSSQITDFQKEMIAPKPKIASSFFSVALSVAL